MTAVKRSLPENKLSTTPYPAVAAPIICHPDFWARAGSGVGLVRDQLNVLSPIDQGRLQEGLGLCERTTPAELSAV
jgi:hypothetical protein